MAQRCDIRDVGVLGAHADARDLARCLEPEVRPRAAAVGGAIHTIAMRDVAAHRCLAHAHIHHVVVRRRHRDRAHAARAECGITHAFPRVARVVAAPHAAAGRAHIEAPRLARHAGDRDHAARPERPHVAPMQVRVERRIDRVRRGLAGDRGRGRGDREGRAGHEHESDVTDLATHKGGNLHTKRRDCGRLRCETDTRKHDARAPEEGPARHQF